MTSYQWLLILSGLVVHAGALTAFFYREFATKKDLVALETHLREINDKSFDLILEKIHSLHQDVQNIQKTLSERMTWKQ